MLILHLQRIVFDMDTFVNKKLNQRIEFPSVLNVQPYMLSEVIKESKELSGASKGRKTKAADQNGNEPVFKYENSKLDDEDEEMDSSPTQQHISTDTNPVSNQDDDMASEGEQETGASTEQEPKENFEYKLVGVVVHMGTADAGHYLSYINISRGEKDEESPEWLQTEKEKWLEFNDSQVRSYS